MKNRYIDGLKFKNPHPFRTDAEKMLDAFHTDVYIKNGVVRWKSNQNVPPSDILEFWNYIGFDFDFEKTKKAREKDITELLGSYTKNKKDPSDETMYEMRAAFGKDVDVIDVVSDKHYRT